MQLIHYKTQISQIEKVQMKEIEKLAQWEK